MSRDEIFCVTFGYCRWSWRSSWGEWHSHTRRNNRFMSLCPDDGCHRLCNV